MEKITLTFRRGGDWELTPGLWFWRFVDGDGAVPIVVGVSYVATANREYAGPFALEVAAPDPEPVEIEGCSYPKAIQSHAPGQRWHCSCGHIGSCETAVHVSASTRREAIEAYNAAAKVMGGK